MAATAWKNLAARTTEFVVVTLDYRRDSITSDAEIRVTVNRRDIEEDFTLYPAPFAALDCYHHPYAYAHSAMATGRIAPSRVS